MLVWNAMPSITEMMSAMRLALSLISVIVVTTRTTSAPPCSARFEAVRASSSAWRALSAFCFTVLVSSSMLAAVSSRLEACSSVRCDRSVVPAATWPDARHHRLGRDAHLRHHLAERGIHPSQGLQQLARLVVAPGVDLGAQVALGDALGEAHRDVDRPEHGAPEEEPERAQREQHGEDGPADGQAIAGVGVAHRLERALRADVAGGRLRVDQHLRGPAIDSLDRLVARVGIEIALLERIAVPCDRTAPASLCSARNFSSIARILSCGVDASASRAEPAVSPSFLRNAFQCLSSCAGSRPRSSTSFHSCTCRLKDTVARRIACCVSKSSRVMASSSWIEW